MVARADTSQGQAGARLVDPMRERGRPLSRFRPPSVRQGHSPRRGLRFSGTVFLPVGRSALGMAARPAPPRLHPGPGSAIQISWNRVRLPGQGRKALAGLSGKDGCDLRSDVVDRITAEQVSILTPPGGQVRLPDSLACPLQVGKVSIFERGFGGYVSTSASAAHILTTKLTGRVDIHVDHDINGELDVLSVSILDPKRCLAFYCSSRQPN